MEFEHFFSFCPHCGSNEFLINNLKSKKCDSCGFVFYVNASAAVAAFITDSDGNLLVCKRAKEPAIGTYDLPGGFIDAAETAEQAISRELSEELNASVKSLKYLFSIPNTYLYSGLNVPTLDMFFECELDSTDNLKASDDVASFLFISKSNLNPDDFGLSSIKKAIELFKTT